ncbi:MAG: glutamine--fructose-6-phosphate transaminase (isomerizing) [Ruminiclostridium sp.]|nr:glutamine--fructose-6-phosphate transaminase (isomerizing) [Ruminiclostridium sp.]
MCGIVGYTGRRECRDILVNSLKKLEYRGYDSAGIAVIENGSIKTIKAKGKISEGLESKLAETGKLDAVTGIGHTRWATHGEPSDINSHPIGNSRITIVHNGIIENYRKLKSFLIDKGYNFESETDTETVAKLLDYYYTGNPIEAISKAVTDIEGAYALGIMFKDYPDMIYAVRKDSPLIVGSGNGEMFIASDMTALLEYTKEYYLLETGEIASIRADGVSFCDLHGNKLTKQIQTATWDVSEAEKGGFEHFMLKEIHEQPSAVKKTVSPRIKDGLPCFEECGLTDEMLRNYHHIYIIACGSAMHAGMIGKYIIESLARTPVIVDIASEFRYRNPLLKSDDLVVIVSQSGETADTKAALELANEVGADTLALVNVVGSSIAREAKMVMYTYAGPEISVASTKAYMVQSAFMYLLAFRVSLARGAISEDECRTLVKKLEEIPDLISDCISDLDPYRKAASRLIGADSLLYIGRGLDYALSMEGSLKLKEISYIHSESYAAGELKHGTISLIDDGMPVIAVATQRELLAKTISNMREVKTRGAYVIAVCPKGTAIDAESADEIIEIPAADDMLMPLVAVVPLQLIAYYASVLRGNDVDKPRNLAKSVTVE